jgi:hypothetical protein
LLGNLFCVISDLISCAMESYNWIHSDWITECIDLWESIPNCQFWNSQWADVIARVVKNYPDVDWEGLLPLLFAKYLNMFEVSISILLVMLVLFTFWFTDWLNMIRTSLKIIYCVAFSPLLNIYKLVCYCNWGFTFWTFKNVFFNICVVKHN